MKKITNILLMLSFSLGLVACSNLPPNNYLVYSRPVINIAAPIAHVIEVETSKNNIRIKNQSENQVVLVYKLTWYDQNGVTQLAPWQQSIQWNKLSLAPQQTIKIPLNKSTPISVNYRLFIREN